MLSENQLNLVEDYMNFLGKMYIILLSSLDEIYEGSISINEKIILQILDDSPIPIKEISLRTGLAVSTLTHVIDKMENKKLIRRKNSPEDRRVINIELAEAGKALKSDFNQLIRKISAVLLEVLSETDRDNFISSLEATIRQMSQFGSTKMKEIVAPLIEPIKLTMIKQFDKDLL